VAAREHRGSATRTASPDYRSCAGSGHIRDGVEPDPFAQVALSRNSSRNRCVAPVFWDRFRDDPLVDDTGGFSNAVRIGYARVSGQRQDHQLQLDALAGAGCREVIVETASTPADSTSCTVSKSAKKRWKQAATASRPWAWIGPPGSRARSRVVSVSAATSPLRVAARDDRRDGGCDGMVLHGSFQHRGRTPRRTLFAAAGLMLRASLAGAYLCPELWSGAQSIR
jgi:hypothetical protein